MQFKPFPPTTLRASDDDIAALEALVRQLGWEEMMYRLGTLIARQAEETTGPHKSALTTASSLVNLWGPSFHWCDEAVCRALMERHHPAVDFDDE